MSWIPSNTSRWPTSQLLQDKCFDGWFELLRVFKPVSRERGHEGSASHVVTLLSRLDGRSGGGCPAVFGIGEDCYVED